LNFLGIEIRIKEKMKEIEIMIELVSEIKIEVEIEKKIEIGREREIETRIDIKICHVTLDLVTIRCLGLEMLTLLLILMFLSIET
jgi:hypothetical protein